MAAPEYKVINRKQRSQRGHSFGMTDDDEHEENVLVVVIFMGLTFIVC